MECEGRSALPDMGTRAGAAEPCGGLSSPPERAAGPNTSLKRELSRGPYSLAMAKGFSTSILPQSAMITSFRGLSRPSVLVLSTFRTTSWRKGGSNKAGQVRRSATQGRQTPAHGQGGLKLANSVQTSRHRYPSISVRENPVLTRGSRQSDPLK